jgi:hypothetical protein
MLTLSTTQSGVPAEVSKMGTPRVWKLVVVAAGICWTVPAICAAMMHLAPQVLAVLLIIGCIEVSQSCTDNA